MKKGNFLFGFVLGVMCTFAFIVVAANIDKETVYIVTEITDDNTVTLKNVDNGNFIMLSVENPYDESYEPGQQIIVQW